MFGCVYVAAVEASRSNFQFLVSTFHARSQRAILIAIPLLRTRRVEFAYMNFNAFPIIVATSSVSSPYVGRDESTNLAFSHRGRITLIEFHTMLKLLSLFVLISYGSL